MMNILHPSEFECVPAGRFKRLALAHRTFPHNQVAELTSGTAQMVYVFGLPDARK